SSHIGMLAAGVPCPAPEGSVWAEWLYGSLVAGGVIVFLTLALPRLGRHGVLIQTLVTFLVVAATRETLRAAVMNGVVTGGWAYSAPGLVKPVLGDLILAFLRSEERRV